MSNKISPYIYPGLKVEMLDVSKHPYLYKLKDRMNEDVIIKIILERFGITHEQMVSKNRNREFVDARLIVAYILRKKCRLTYTHIGHKIGNRDHTTAIHNVRKFEDVYETDVSFRKLSNIVFDKVGLEPLMK
jgi:chromosomal replication initiation ATPase DnaA